MRTTEFRPWTDRRCSWRERL